MNRLKISKKSFAARLSLKFMMVLAGTMMLLTAVFVFFVNASVRNQEADQLKKNAEQIFDRLEEGQFDYYAPYGISWSVFKEDKSLLFTNDPFVPWTEDTEGKTDIYFVKNYFTDGDLNLRYFAADRFVSVYNQQLMVVTAITEDKSFSSQFLSNLPEVLLLTIIPVLVISYLLCLLISRNIIRPVVKITQSAREISSSSLNRMLPVTGNEDEIDELSKTFNSLFKKLDADFARERQFSSDVSHELKTPLTVISGQTSLLLRWGKNDPEQLEKSLFAIKTEAKSMQSIIENLLKISRYESGMVKPEKGPVVIKELFLRLKNEFETINPEIQIKFSDISENLVIMSDEELLHQIFTILISNSIKFAGKDCQVGLQVLKNNEKWIFLVEDNGPGFSDEMLPHIFERFYRGDEAHSRKAGGFGLGLSIAKSLVCALEGTIKAENSENHGALFTLSFTD